MQILVYEYIAGGGTYSSPRGLLPEGGLLAEGTAMARALLADFAKIPGIDVVALHDGRLSRLDVQAQFHEVKSAGEEKQAFYSLAASSDFTVVIAPEIDGALLERTDWVLAAGGKLLSPGPEAVRLASDKHATATWLASKSVSVPKGLCLPSWAKWNIWSQDPQNAAYFDQGWIIKPTGGAGSLGVHRLTTADILAPANQGEFEFPLRVEEFCPGLAASCAVLCGIGEQFIPLPACQQLFQPGTFDYVGGKVLPGSSSPANSPANLQQRAQQLALQAVRSLPPSLGYIGVDLVLGFAENGSQDRVLEINPRLTTSYVGLRAVCQQNLAQAMLDLAEGKYPALSFSAEELQFRADGTLVSRG